MAEHDPGPRGANKGQRYYLYDNELSRPKFQPRSFHRPQRPPFSSHEYCGIYPTKPEDNSNRFFIPERVPRESCYTRPEDVYHGSGPSRDDLHLWRERERRDSSDRRSSHEYHSSSRYHEDERYRERRYPEDNDDYRYRRRSGSSQERSRRRTRSRSMSRSPYGHRRGHSDEGRRKQTPTPEPEVHQDETDLKIELHPLMHYVEDKPKLLKEAMSILRGKRLEALIPPELRGFSLSRLEHMCLKELNTISLVTIANVIDGKIINADKTVQRKVSKKDIKAKRKAKAEASIPLKKIKKKLKKSISQDNDNEPPTKKKKKKHEKTDPVVVKKSKSSKEKSKSKKAKEKLKKKKKKAKEASAAAALDVPGLPPQKTLMELLELEYRAKAIKALLKTQGLDMNRIDDALSLNTSPPPNTATDEPSVEIPILAQTKISDPIPSAPPAVVPVTVTTPTIPAVSPDSTVIHEASDLTPLSKPESPIQVSPNLTKEESSDEDEGNSYEDQKKVPPVEEEELDYEPDSDEELVIQPPTPIEIEIEEGEIASGEESEPEAESTGFGTFGKETEKGKYVYSSNSDSEEDEVGGWRVHDSDNDGPERRRRWVKDPSPEAVYKRDNLDLEQLSDISNQELPEVVKEKEAEVSKKGKLNNADSDSDDNAYLYQPRSPTPTDADGNPIPRSSDEESDEDNFMAKPDSGIIMPEEVHTCAERPDGHQDQNSEQESDSEDDTPRTWFNRWYNSQKVQKNVKSNKMLGRLRTKLRREKLIPELKLGPSANAEPESLEDIPIIGSIQEYERLYASGKYKPEPVPEPEPVVEEPAVESESGSDDEALWSDILGTSNNKG